MRRPRRSGSIRAILPTGDSGSPPGTNAEVERFLRSRGVEPRVVFRAEDNNLLQGLAAQGIGAAIMPIMAVDRSRNDIVLVDLAGQIPPRRIGLIWHRDRYQTPAANAFIQLAREMTSSLAEWVAG